MPAIIFRTLPTLGTVYFTGTIDMVHAADECDGKVYSVAVAGCSPFPDDAWQFNEEFEAEQTASYLDENGPAGPGRRWGVVVEDIEHFERTASSV